MRTVNAGPLRAYIRAGQHAKTIIYGVSFYIPIHHIARVFNLLTMSQQRNGRTRDGNRLFQQLWEAGGVAATSAVLQRMLKFREGCTLIQSHTAPKWWFQMQVVGCQVPAPFTLSSASPPLCLDPVTGTPCSNTGHSVFLQQKDSNREHARLPFPCAHSSLWEDGSNSSDPRVPTASCKVETVTASLNPTPIMGEDLKHMVAMLCPVPSTSSSDFRIHLQLTHVSRSAVTMLPRGNGEAHEDDATCSRHKAAGCRSQAILGPWLFQ